MTLPTIGKELPRGWRIDDRGNLRMSEEVLDRDPLSRSNLGYLAKMLGAMVSYNEEMREYIFEKPSIKSEGTLAIQMMKT